MRRSIRHYLPFLLLAVAPWANSATIDVNSLADDEADDGQCTLREAIIAANSGNSSGSMPGECAGGEFDPVVDRIEFTDAVTGTINLNSALPNVNDPIDLIGPGADDLTIDGNAITTNTGALRIVSPTLIEGIRFVNTTSTGSGGAINTSQPLTLREVVIEDNAARAGGGVYSEGDTTIERSVFRNNTATDFDGGAVNLANSGKTLIVHESLFEGNQAAPGARSGGAINVGGSDHVTEISGSTFIDNAVNGGDRFGGAIRIGGASLSVVNSTFTGNAATLHGGAIWASATDQVLANVTVQGNTADSDANGFGDGGGVWGNNPATIRNSLMAGNSDPGGESPDCSGNLTSGGHNLIGDGSGCAGFTDGVNGDHVGSSAAPIDPVLGPLSDNGGPTSTLALLAGSPAIDAGDPAGCTDEQDDPLGIDQRGSPRPADGDGDGNALCDIGAFESQADAIFRDRFEG